MTNPDSDAVKDNPMKLWSSSWTVSEAPLYVEAGDLCLTITRLAHEWQLHYHWIKRGENGNLAARYLDASSEPQLPPDRVVMESMPSEITLVPKLADRPIVVRPRSPFIIPANNTVTLFVSTPLWLCISFSNEVSRELPVQQLSDTWMGLLTGQGELCYGSQTHARLDEKNLLHLPYHASISVTMHNKGSEDFTLERLSIPTLHLSLYEGGDQLITEPLKIVMDSETQQGIVELGEVAGKAIVSPPREKIEKGNLVNAWENLFA